MMKDLLIMNIYDYFNTKFDFKETYLKHDDKL